MNRTELKMVDVLRDLKGNYSVVGVKAEFEAEGTRMEELMRLKEICLTTGVSLVLKIGGCETVRDMYDARAIGVNSLVVPMVESAFALEKYLNAIDIVFPLDEQEEIEFLVNIETVQAAQNFSEMLKIPKIEKLNGIVVGRVDLTMSLGLGQEAINEEKIFVFTQDILKKAKQQDLLCVVGGAISVEAIPFLQKMPKGLMNRYETRKVCFSCSHGLGKNADEGIQKAVEFELLWLENKRNYYRMISEEDDKRIVMLKKRLGKFIK